jgi:NRE family putative nickel resistance protein-like MFS transporter
MSSMLGPLRRRTFRRLVASQFMAETGDGVTLVALPLYVFERTNSALATSLTFTAELVGSVLLGVVGGVLADAFDRRLVLMISAVIRGLLLVCAFAAGPVWLVVVFGVAARSMGAVDDPSFSALIPGQAQGDMQQVLAVRRLIQAVSITVGPAVGALAVELIGSREAILLNAGAFVGSVAFMATLPGIDRTLASRRALHDGRSWRSRIGELIAGSSIVATTPRVRRFVGYNVFVMATVAASMGAAVIWYEVDLGVSGSWFGLAVASYGIGSAIGMGLAGGHDFRVPLPVVIAVAGPLYALGATIGVAADAPWLLPLGWLLWGISLGPEFVLGELTIVENVPEPALGRAFAGVGIANMLGMAAGYAVIGPLLDRYGARPVMLVNGALVLALTVSWIGPALSWFRDPTTSPWTRSVARDPSVMSTRQGDPALPPESVVPSWKDGPDDRS